MAHMRMGCTLVAVMLVGETLAVAADRARGVVFHDRNNNGRRDVGEQGVADVRVSNGRDIVQTATTGAYELPVNGDTILFVIKPRGWMTAVNELNLPAFHYIHKPAGSPAALKYPGVSPTGPLPASIDFPLYKRAEPDRFTVLLFGDSQPYSIQEVDFFAHDIVEQVIGIDAAFGMSLGDLVGDDLRLFDPLNRAVAHIGIPFYNVLGNHDIDFTAKHDLHSDEAYERTYGPPYYSFDYGPVHFVVLDDVVWHGATEDKDGHYTAGLGAKQLEFVRNDLALLDKEQLVVLTMHIPIVEIAERKELFTLLAEHPNTVSFSAHWHVHRHWFLSEEHGWTGAQPHHHTTFVTTSGSWWRGAPDEVGVPHTMMRDGGPNGWCVATFDGTEYSYRFQAARRPVEYQMNIWTPEVVKSAKAAETEVVANFFMGSERAKVEMRFNRGPWTQMERSERPDPYYAALKAAEKGDDPPRGRKLPRLENSPHVWVGHLPADPPAGTHLIEVRTTDMFGQEHWGRRLMRVE